MLRAIVLAMLMLPSLRASADPAPVPTEYQLGVRIRGIFITRDMLAPFLTAATSMASVAVGGEFIYRRPTYDVVTSLDLSFVSPEDGNYLGADKDPAQDTHYVQFHNLSFLSMDVSIIGHYAVNKWLELRYGGGIGLGLVFGDVVLTNDSNRCTAQNASDVSKCYPISPTVGEIPLGRPDTEAKLKATEDPNKIDLARDPHRHVSADKPPVLPVVNLVVGARFKLHRHLAAQLELGFRDAVFIGTGLHYLF
jgi:hypothetical protein